MKFIQAHWKAIMPLAAAAIALAADHVADLDLSPQTATIITSVLAVVLVFLKANVPAEPKAADKDAGLALLEVVVIIVAVAVVVIAIKVF